MTPARSCPICPNCSSKKFQKLQSQYGETRLICLKCKKIIEI